MMEIKKPACAGFFIHLKKRCLLMRAFGSRSRCSSRSRSRSGFSGSRSRSCFRSWGSSRSRRRSRCSSRSWGSSRSTSGFAATSGQSKSQQSNNKSRTFHFFPQEFKLKTTEFCLISKCPQNQRRGILSLQCKKSSLFLSVNGRRQNLAYPAG